MSGKTSCECCQFYSYDEEDDTYYCEVDLDEDEMMRFLSSGHADCPYWRPGDEYLLARRQ
ncbi:MAG: DUF6472 family protein [Oscillibacter sp.]|nr:DUF6472 family protein [Oscillibacter sp.]